VIQNSYLSSQNTYFSSSLSLIKLKASSTSVNIGFPRISSYFGHNIHSSPINHLIHFSIFFSHNHSKCSHKLTSLHNCSKQFMLGACEIFYNPPTLAKWHNVYFQATNITNIHNLPNSSQIYILDSKINITLAWSWNPRLGP